MTKAGRFKFATVGGGRVKPNETPAENAAKTWGPDNFKLGGTLMKLKGLCHQ